MHHIHKTQKGKAHFFSGSRLPNKAAFQRTPAHIQFPTEIPELNLSQVQFFAVQRDFRHQPIGSGDHEVGLRDDAAIGAVQALYIVYAVHVSAPERIHAAALVKAAAHAQGFIGQGKDRFADPGIGGVEAFLDDLPGIHPEINVCRFCHMRSFLSP